MALRVATIALSLASLPFILPHVVEDFALGIAHRVGLTTGVGALLLGAWLAIQTLGLVLVAVRRRAGWWITVGIGVVWVGGAVVDHGPEIVAGHFREGWPSLAWVLGLVATQSAAAALAGVGLRCDRIAP